MTITGTIPSTITNFLKVNNESLNGIEIKGNDIDVIFTDNGTYTELYAIGMGNGTYEIIEIEDNLNLLPEYEESDVISNDVLKKLFSTVINSSLILSFNPLGRVKYGIREVGKKVGDVGRKVVDWAADRLYAEDAEKFIRANGPYRRTFTDSRDGVTRTKKDYNAGRVNVGKIESLGKMGHYKVLSGNPATGDFQVWHLYKNGNKIRCVDLKTGLQAQEAQWVYDNNIPKSWTEADWNPSGDVPEKASKIEIGQGDVPEEKTDNQTEQSQETEQTEDNVVETEETTEQTEDNVIDDMDPDSWMENPDDWEDVPDESVDIVKEDSDNVIEEEPKKKKKKSVAASFDKSSEEDNVVEIDSKKKKKSKYNGCNVTGYQNGDLISPMSVGDGGMAIGSSLLIINNLIGFLKETKNYRTSVKRKQKIVDDLSELSGRLNTLAHRHPKVLKQIEDNDGGNAYEKSVCFNFDKAGTNVKGTINLSFEDTGFNITPGYTIKDVTRKVDELLNYLP